MWRIMYLIDLPTEIIIEIFKNVSYKDIVNLSIICCKLYNIIINFIWPQTCLINKLQIPNNIHFANLFFQLPNDSSFFGILEFHITILQNTNTYNAIICNSSNFIDFLQNITCNYFIIIDNLCTHRTFRIDPINKNALVYLRNRENYNTLSRKINSNLFKIYDHASHSKILGNNDYIDDVDNYDYINDYCWNCNNEKKYKIM